VRLIQHSVWSLTFNPRWTVICVQKWFLPPYLFDKDGTKNISIENGLMFWVLSKLWYAKRGLKPCANILQRIADIVYRAESLVSSEWSIVCRVSCMMHDAWCLVDGGCWMVDGACLDTIAQQGIIMWLAILRVNYWIPGGGRTFQHSNIRTFSRRPALDPLKSGEHSALYEPQHDISRFFTSAVLDESESRFIWNNDAWCLIDVIAARQHVLAECDSFLNVVS
jgi:hypothetical protein